jgi:predicted transposase YdaD
MQLGGRSLSAIPRGLDGKHRATCPFTVRNAACLSCRSYASNAVTNTPHDAVFKAVFEQPEHAAAELQHVLSADLVAAIDWSSLALEPGSFVDEELADQHSDLLFSATATASQERVFVYLLFEHQSSNDPKMALRLLSYMVRIWSRFGQAHPADPLPLIVPAVLAQVPGGWSSPTRFSALFSPVLRELGRSVLPDFSFAVDDLHTTSDDELRRRALADQAKLTLWLMRDARDGAAVLRHIADWAEMLESLAAAPGGQAAMARLLRYLVLVSDDLQLAQIRDMLRERAPAAEAMTMTIAEQLRTEGEAKGRVEGEAAGVARSVLMILEARKLRVADAVRARIAGCQDVETLEGWLVRAATAASAEEVFDA